TSSRQWSRAICSKPRPPRSTTSSDSKTATEGCDVKVIVPLAGKGTRLLPLTKRVPKPLIHVAGRPVMDYVMDAVRGAGLEVDEIIVITGHLKDVVETYITTHYDVPAQFVEQQTLDGTAGAINLARPYVDGPVMIIFVDTLFDADLSVVKRTDADGILWAKEVEDYQRFGVIVTDKRGYMTLIVGEVTGWYDCGKVDTLLETNHHLLEHGRARRPKTAPKDVIIRDPVYIEDGVRLANSTIGPNVSLGAGSSVTGSTVANSILG